MYLCVYTSGYQINDSFKTRFKIMKITKRVSQSPLLQYANFADGSHVNLIRILKPYADGRSYFVHETTKSIFCSSGYFTTYEQALTKFKLMVRNGSQESRLISTGTLGYNLGINNKTLNTLPIIIKSEGIYLLRDGRTASIHSIKPNDNLEVTAFTCKGNIERMYRGKMVFKGYCIWHESGRSSGVENSGDIVKKIT